MRFLIYVCITVILVALSGCGGGGGTAGISNAGSNLTSTVTVAGKVVDSNDNAVSGATVVVDGAITLTTNTDGQFFAAVASPGADGTPVRFTMSKGGYVTTHSTVRVYQNTLYNGVHESTLRLQRAPATAEEATQILITRADGTTETIIPTVTTDTSSGLTVAESTVLISDTDRAVTFTTPVEGATQPSVSMRIGDPTGAGANAAAVIGATGNITGSITYGDPTDRDALKMFPGEFVTTSDTGNGVSGEGALVTAGFAKISLTDSNGAPITQFNGGNEIQITMRVPESIENPETGIAVAEGDTIPIFAYNEDTGEWVVETNENGSVKRSTVRRDEDGLYVTFPMTHLTWVNLDWKSTQCPTGIPKVTFVDGSGNRLSWVRLKLDAGGWWDWDRYLYDGMVEFQSAPKDIEWQLWGEKGDGVSRVATIKDCKDTLTGKTDFELVIDVNCEIGCDYSWDCNDNDDMTYDYCHNANTCNSYCKNVPCYVSCNSDSNCDDSNPATNDKCYGSGKCWSYCQNCSTTAAIACYNNEDCDDGNSYTFDYCGNPGDGCAYCGNCNIKCFENADCDDNNSLTLDVCEYPGNCGSKCANCVVSCISDSDCNDNNINTVDTCDDAGTCRAYCSNKSCASDTDCDDGISTTLDSCNNPGAASSTCAHTLITCGSDTDCSSPTPYCKNQGTASSECVRCGSDTDCSSPTPYCKNQGTASSECVRCISNTNCDDGISTTLDSCNNPGTASATCAHTAITCASDTDCSSPTPYCKNQGTASSECVRCASTSHCQSGEFCYNNSCIDSYSTTSCSLGACFATGSFSFGFSFDIPTAPNPPTISNVNATPAIAGTTSFTVTAQVEGAIQLRHACLIGGLPVANPQDYYECCNMRNWDSFVNAGISPNPPDIIKVKLYYYENDDIATTSSPIDMSFNTGSGLWAANVPISGLLKAGDTITFYIAAADHMGNVASQVPDTIMAPCVPGTTSWDPAVSTPALNSCQYMTQHEKCQTVQSGKPVSCGAGFSVTDSTGDTCSPPDSFCGQALENPSDSDTDAIGLSVGSDSDYLCLSLGLGAAPPSASDDPPIERYTYIIYNPDIPDSDTGDRHLKNAFAITYTPELQGYDPTLVRVLWDLNCITDPSTTDLSWCRIKAAIPGDTDLSMVYAGGGLTAISKIQWSSKILTSNSAKPTTIVAYTEKMNLAGENMLWLTDQTSAINFYHTNTTVTILSP